MFAFIYIILSRHNIHHLNWTLVYVNYLYSIDRHCEICSVKIALKCGKIKMFLCSHFYLAAFVTLNKANFTKLTSE